MSQQSDFFTSTIPISAGAYWFQGPTQSLQSEESLQFLRPKPTWRRIPKAKGRGKRKWESQRVCEENRDYEHTKDNRWPVKNPGNHYEKSYRQGAKEASRKNRTRRDYFREKSCVIVTSRMLRLKGS